MTAHTMSAESTKVNMAEAPRDRAYDPQRRPNIYYKGDPASENALLDRAIEAYDSGRMEGFNTPEQPRYAHASDIVHGVGHPFQKSTPMTVAEADERAAAGNPISPDATAMQAVAGFGDNGRGSVDEMLLEAQYERDNAKDARRDADEAVEKAQGAEAGAAEAKKNVLKSLPRNQ